MSAATYVVASLLAAQTTGGALSGNVTLANDYRFRGVSQTYTQPAIQGGLEFAPNFYLGAWGSNVSGNQFLNGGSLELDLYGGYRFDYAKLSWDFGAQYYRYPGARYNIDPGDTYHTLELYAGVRYRQFSAKYWHAVSDLFGMNTNTVGGYCGISSDGTPETTDCLGTGSTKGSGYVDLNASFDVIEGVNLALHGGYQSVRNYSQLSYADYKVGLSRQFGGITLGAAAVGTNAESRFYRYTPTTAGSQETQDVAKSTIVLSASRAF